MNPRSRNTLAQQETVTAAQLQKELAAKLASLGEQRDVEHFDKAERQKLETLDPDSEGKLADEEWGNPVGQINTQIWSAAYDARQTLNSEVHRDDPVALLLSRLDLDQSALKFSDASVDFADSVLPLAPESVREIRRMIRQLTREDLEM